MQAHLHVLSHFFIKVWRDGTKISASWEGNIPGTIGMGIVQTRHLTGSFGHTQSIGGECSRLWSFPWSCTLAKFPAIGWSAWSARWTEDGTLRLADRCSQGRTERLPDLRVNCGPWSDMILEGIPCRQKTWSTMISAVSLADRSLGRAKKWAALKKR